MDTESQKPGLTKDEEWLLRLFRTLPDAEQHDYLVKLGRQAVKSNLIPEQPDDLKPSDVEDWQYEAVDEEIDKLQPGHSVDGLQEDLDNSDYPDQYKQRGWLFILLQHVLPDGPEEAILGSHEMISWHSEALANEFDNFQSDYYFNYMKKNNEIDAFFPKWRYRLIRKIEEKIKTGRTKQHRDYKAWVLREHKAIVEEWPMGSKTELDLMDHWKEHSPKMHKELAMMEILPETAHVLQEKMYQEMQANKKMRMPPTDAREQAEANWLILEPESELF